MHTDYRDIRTKAGGGVQWYDEHAVPRYDAFHPQACANVYADEVVLMEVRCQGCSKSFAVCMSKRRGDVGPTLAEQISDKSIHYGDPPNIGCCPAGPTMNSVPIKVLQYWRRNTSEAMDPGWAAKDARKPAMEISLEEQEKPQ